MGYLATIERMCLIGHLVAMAFGLSGLLWVMPHPELLQYIPAGTQLFQWSMATGGVFYILLGAITVALHTYRTLGLRVLLSFFVPAVIISLSSELLGTSTGFPFGHYSYLSGLGYKVAGLVPITIPLSWFYLGLSAYLLARSGCMGLGRVGLPDRLMTLSGVILGATLLTSWDFVLDPAMSQTAMPFWYWHQPGDFFGMPYQNFIGWLGTGTLFMAVAALIWTRYPQTANLTQLQLRQPLIIYLANVSFATVMSVSAGIYIPVLLGLALGALPAILCWKACPTRSNPLSDSGDPLPLSTIPSSIARSVGITSK